MINYFKPISIVLGLCLILLGVVILIISIFKKLSCRMKINAFVVNMLREYRNGRIVYVPEIGYMIDDVEYYKKLSPSNKYGIKQRVPILVNEKNHNSFIIEGSAEIFVTIFIIMLGIGLIVISKFL